MRFEAGAVGWLLGYAERVTASSRAKLARTGQRMCWSLKRTMLVHSRKAITSALLLNILRSQAQH